MSRDASYVEYKFGFAAGAATLYDYWSVPARFLFQGWAWVYGDGLSTFAAEGGTDNTVTVTIDYTVDGTNFVALKPVNGNTAGWLDSGAPGVLFRNPSNPASAGVAWGAESSPTDVVVPANATIRVKCITAGTSTPISHVYVYGHFIATAE